MSERTCRTLGEPDFVVMAGGGRVLFVECKSRTGKLSPAQAALKHHGETLGHTLQVVRSREEKSWSYDILDLTTGGEGL